MREVSRTTGPPPCRGQAAARPWWRRAAAAVLAAALAAGCASPGGEEPWPAPPEVEAEPEPEVEPQGEGWSKEKKLLVVNAGVAAAIAAYGLQFWDYGGASWRVADEGWFGKDTAYGGADKLGHAYSAYLATLGFSALYEHWGFERRDADLYGAASSMGAFTLIEVGDAMSKNGWSTEDLIADAAGVLMGYWRRRRPKVAEYLDFRVEYIPSDTFIEGGRHDIFTDYSGFKYLLALKLSGFEGLRTTPAQYVELHVGYYTRGFLEQDKEFYDEETRTLYVGVGLNISRVLEKLGVKRSISNIFKYYQLPYTYVPADWGID